VRVCQRQLNILVYQIHIHIYFLSQQKKSKPSIFCLNHNGEITLLPNENSVSAASVHSLTERMNNIISNSKCSLLSLDRSENSLSTAALAGNPVFSSMYSFLMSR